MEYSLELQKIIQRKENSMSDQLIIVESPAKAKTVKKM